MSLFGLMKILASIFFFLHLSQFSFSQPVTQEWVQHYNFMNDYRDYGRKLALDKNGNIFITGFSQPIPFLKFDMVTIKYSPAGEQMWVKRYSHSNWYDNCLGFDIMTDDTGNVYVLCDLQGKILIEKYSNSGNTIWSSIPDSTYGCKKFKMDSQGNIYIVASGDYRPGVSIAKLKSNGELVWYKTKLSNWPGAWGQNIIIDKANNIYATGIMTYYGGGDNSGSLRNWVVMKYTENGDSIWTKRFTPPTSVEEPVGLDVDNDCNIVISGGRGGKFTTVMLDSSGNQLWSNQYSPNHVGVNVGEDVKFDSKGNIVVCGKTHDNESPTNYQFTTLKFTSHGDVVFISDYNPTPNSSEAAISLTLDSNDNIYATGYGGISYNQSEMMTVKYDPLGNIQWVMRYHPNVDTILINKSNDIILDNARNVYVTGFSTTIENGSQLTLLKYSQTVGVQTVEGQIPSHIKIYQNFPNPFNPSTNIKFDLPQAGFVKLSVFDILGRKVAVLVNEKLNAGTYSYQLSMDSYQMKSGVYFYQIQAGDFVETKKMVLIK